LCNDLREQTAQLGGSALRLNTEILAALIEARCRRPAEALRSACSALDVLSQSQPLSDAQSDLVNVAELAMCLNRVDLARPLLRSLQAFSVRPDHRLRDWVGDRMRAIIERDAPPLDDDSACDAPARTHCEVLASLATLQPELAAAAPGSR
jgi:hypothetical protein